MPGYPQATAYWQILLVLGAVVIVAVVVLLGLLVAYIKRINTAVNGVAGTLIAITENTKNTELILTVGGGLDLVLAEGLEHHLFLGRVYDSIPTPAPVGSA